jgi:hypothetical protein
LSYNLEGSKTLKKKPRAAVDSDLFAFFADAKKRLHASDSITPGTAEVRQRRLRTD